jgi:hypothetical protein
MVFGCMVVQELQAGNGEALDLGKGNVRPLCRWVQVLFLVDSGGRAALKVPRVKGELYMVPLNFRDQNRTCN